MQAALGDPLPLSLDWDFGANGHLTSGGLLEGADRQRFLLASLGRRLYALGDDGQRRWSVDTRGPVYALASIGDDLAAIGDDAGLIHLVTASGDRLWQVDLGSRVTHLLAWSDGLLAGGWEEQVTCLSTDPPAPEVRWSFPTGGPVAGLATLPGLAVVATTDGILQGMDSGGNPLWRLEAGAPLYRLGSIVGGQAALVLAALQDGRLLAVSDGGNLLWAQALGTSVDGAPVFHAITQEDSAGPWIAAGTSGADPELILLSADGVVHWRVRLPSNASAITTEDLDGDGSPELVAGLASGAIEVFDLEGRLRGEAHAGLAVWHLVPAGDGTVMVLADVVAWRLKAGQGPAGGPWLPPPAMVPIESGAGSAGGEAVLALLGDVSPGRTMEMQLARYGPAHPWVGLKGLLDSADLAMANLEGVLTTRGTPLDKSYLIRAHPGWGQTLLEAGLDVVSLANNHALDYGEAGLDDTLATLEALGIRVVGAGQSVGTARAPQIFEVNGLRIAVLAYAAARWDGSVDVPATDRIAWARSAAVKADVQAAREQADLVVVSLHAGTEYASQPSDDQVTIAHAAIDAGAHLVVGHHPHVVQTVERYGDGLIVYSLGDALFDIPRRAAMLGHLLRVVASREGLVRAELWPFWIEAAIRPRLLSDGQGAPRVQVVYP